ncbi:MAG: hypothetical protein HEP71_12555 [Roseivirga sp.]|nr:hypothetical protein [Roseivirga sp.]
MKQLVLIGFLLVLKLSLQSQTIDFGAGVRLVEIDSKVLGEVRELLIYSPNFESGNNLKYPTLYVLDGRENMRLTLGIISNLVRANVIPEVNVVGINNYDYDRLKDLTPAPDTLNNDFGGADLFLRFLETELIPEAQKNLVNSKFRVLIGHSLGGLFSTYVLIREPDLFEGYLQIGSSYWFNEEAIPGALLSENVDDITNKALYFSLSNETDSKEGFDLLQRELPKKTKNVLFEYLENTDHVTGLTPAMFNGLQFVFRDWGGWDKLYESNDFEGIKTKIAYLSSEFDMDVRPQVPQLAFYARRNTEKGSFDRAIEVLTYLESFHPEHIMVLNFLGEAYQKKGENIKAKEIYQRSMKVAGKTRSPMKRWILERLTELGN